MESYILAILVLTVYSVVAVAGHIGGVWKRVGISFYGPMMLWRTQRGHHALQRAAERRTLWGWYSAAGAVIAVGMMVALSLFLLWVVFTSPNLPRVFAASEEIGPGLPTESIVATALYAVVAIVLAVIVHELAHGVAIAWSKIRLESMGVIFLGIPIGAFVEPSEEDMDEAEPETRVRIYSAGAATNMIVAIVCLSLLVAVVPVMQPTQSGALVTAVTGDSPAEMMGMSAWTEVTHIASTQIVDSESFMTYSFESPGTPVAVNMTYGQEQSQVLVPQGVVLTEIFNGPALNAGLRPGMIIKSLNGTVIHSCQELASVVENSSHEHPVTITVLERGYDDALGRDWYVQNASIITINLTSKWLWYYTHFNWLNDDDYRNQSVMGVKASPLGATVRDMDHLTDLYSRPFAGAEGVGGIVDATVRLVALPFIGYSPVIAPATDLYEPSGWASFLPNGVFWVIVNLLYWCFWGNMMLGFANVVPALPFDGGYVFRDLMRCGLVRSRRRLIGIERITHIRRLTDPGEEFLVNTVTYAVTASALIIIGWLILEPIL